MMTAHEIEEREFHDTPLLWDADPDVCCAAYQLGACAHTEADTDDEMTAEEEAAWIAANPPVLGNHTFVGPLAGPPFLPRDNCVACGHNLAAHEPDKWTLDPTGNFYTPVEEPF